MSIVIIAEKPSVAEDLANVLGVGKKPIHTGKATTSSSRGPSAICLNSSTWMIMMRRSRIGEGQWTVCPTFRILFSTNPRAGEQKTTLRHLEARERQIGHGNRERLDAAREGELIFRTIVQHSKVKTPTSRMWMQSMTYDAMLQAFENREAGKPIKRSVMQRIPALKPTGSLA